jgi:hypothetical protein
MYVWSKEGGEVLLRGISSCGFVLKMSPGLQGIREAEGLVQNFFPHSFLDSYSPYIKHSIVRQINWFNQAYSISLGVDYNYWILKFTSYE